MDRRADLLRQWIAAETETEATEAVIALAVEQMTAREAQSSEREDMPSG